MNGKDIEKLGKLIERLEVITFWDLSPLFYSFLDYFIPQFSIRKGCCGKANEIIESILQKIKFYKSRTQISTQQQQPYSKNENYKRKYA